MRILELSHEALLSGNIITKRSGLGHQFTAPNQATSDSLTRSIYYQNMDLFTSQSMVNEMVDNLAFTLGVGRGDLNIARNICPIIPVRG